MTFNDLPSDWPQRSLAEASFAADVIDLFVTDADRETGGFAVFWCDGDGRLIQPAIVAGGTCTEDGTLGHPVIRRSLEVAEELRRSRSGSVSLLFAVVRRSGVLTDADRAWHQQAIEACRDAEVTLHGVFLVTWGRVLALPPQRRRRDGLADRHQSG